MTTSTKAHPIRRLLYGGSTRTGNLSTADLEWFIDDKPNVYLAASAAALSEAQNYAARGNRVVGDLEIDYVGQGGTVQVWQDLSARLRLQGIRTVKPYSGGISVTDKANREAQTDYDRPAFSREQFDYAGSDYDGST